MIFQILLYIFVIIIIIAIVIIYFKLIRPEKQIYDIFRAQGVMGEPFIPLIGQLPETSKQRNNGRLMIYHEELTQKHGYTFLFCFGPLNRLFVSEPDLLADVLSRSNAQNYIKPMDSTAVLGPLIGHHNLLVAEGNEHERARLMLNPAFHHVNLKSMVSIITDRTAKVIESTLASKSSDDEKGKGVDLIVLFNALTLSIIASSAFGADLETNAHAKDVMCRVFAEALEATEYRSMRMVNQIPFLSKLPFWRKTILDTGTRKVGEFVDQIITDRREGQSTSMCSGADLLDLLLSAVDDDGQLFTDQEIKEEALTFVLAGSETTGNLMSWILYILMANDNILQVCREEIDRVLPNGIEPTNEHLTDLVVCEAVINETLRLYPPAPFFTRHCIREHTIGTNRQLRIPVGATIVVSSHILHRRSDLWPRPLEFDYTRWMRDPKTGLKPKLSHPFAYLPFAAGPRNCIGQNFALLEAKIMLAMLVQRCNFEMIPGQKIVPDVKITMRPKYGLWARISKRQI
jgi:cytochrome P450